LLDLKVCDPACGSGHFLIAAAHRIAQRLARLRSGENEPAPEDLRHSLREVIARCIYGVDVNPMAVELCKVNLWLEALEPGKPLSFLDGHIKCGNSLVGVGAGMNLNDLEVPDEAFNPVTGDHKPTAALLKKRNKQERAGQESLFVTVLKTKADLERWLAERARALEAMPEETAAEVQAKAEAYRQVNESAEYRRQRQIADLWTAAFFWKIEEPHSPAYEIVAPTHGQLRRLRQGLALQPGLLEAAERLSRSQGFFHWSLEFPKVFVASSEQRMANGESPLAARQAPTASAGFDCVLGNPPWERIKLQEEEFFAARDPEIAAAPNKAARQKLIDKLIHSNPPLAHAFEEARHAAECSSKFVRQGERYPLTAVGDINSYALFAELTRSLISKYGRLGIIVPTGIATDDSTKDFFGDLVITRALVSLFDFENRETIFPGVHRNYKFSLLTLSRIPVEEADFAFFATRVEHLKDTNRRFWLSPQDISRFNPNTRTVPVFRTSIDASLTRKVYENSPVFVNERNSENPWGASFLRMFDMSNDSHLFANAPMEGFVQLYEAKMIEQFEHRWATWEGNDIVYTTLMQLLDPRFKIQTRYWVPESEVINRVQSYWRKKWFVAFRGITRAVDRRTSWFSVVPYCGVGNSAPVVLMKEGIDSSKIACLVACFNSFVLDFAARQKVGGINFNFFIIQQLPILPPNAYAPADIDFIAPRVLELVYTAYDLKPFAEDMGYQGEPFQWNEERRALLRAELDAYYAKLYDLTRDELRYILDPQDVYGADFPGETFRVLKDKEIRQYGEYRTRRLVLEAWDRLFPDAPVESEIIRRPRPQLRQKPSYMSEYALEGKTLGEGGQAEVFPATHRKSGQRVALKRLSSVGRNIPHAVSRMEYEIQVQGLVQHPNVMPLIDYGEDFTWYTMPLAKQVLSERKPPIDPGELLEIILAVGRGLAAAHDQGYIHRDIKPSNILYIDLPPEGSRWVISDWGLVHRQGLTTEALTRVEAGFGTLGYAPPEFWEDPHGAGIPADVYSLGRVIAWALTGKNPVPNKPLLPDQPGWRELVDEMTREEPPQRLQSMAAVLERLEELRSGEVRKSAGGKSGDTRIEEGAQAAEAVQEKTSPSKRKEPAQNDSPPLMSDFGLYKCLSCEKMVMGFDRESHIHEAHKGKKVEWRRMR
jgi:hypothetical protein